MASSEPPTPTFSPTVVQLPGAPLRLGLWEMPPAAAIFSAQAWAKEERPAFTVRAGRPFEARRALMSETNSPELAADAEPAGMNTASKATTNVAMARMRNFKVPPGLTHGGSGAPFGNPAAVGRELPVGPWLCVLLVSQGLPFRGIGPYFIGLRSRRVRETFAKGAKSPEGSAPTWDFWCRRKDFRPGKRW